MLLFKDLKEKQVRGVNLDNFRESGFAASQTDAKEIAVDEWTFLCKKTADNPADGWTLWQRVIFSACYFFHSTAWTTDFQTWIFMTFKVSAPKIWFLEAKRLTESWLKETAENPYNQILFLMKCRAAVYEFPQISFQISVETSESLLFYYSPLKFRSCLWSWEPLSYSILQNLFHIMSKWGLWGLVFIQIRLSAQRFSDVDNTVEALLYQKHVCYINGTAS